jgi:hypothetical protein
LDDRQHDNLQPRHGWNCDIHATTVPVNADG